MRIGKWIRACAVGVVISAGLLDAVAAPGAAAPSGSAAPVPILYGTSGWEMVPLPFPASNDLELACWTESKCVAADDGPTGGTMFAVTIDGGLTWSPDGSYGDGPYQGISEVSCIQTGACMAVPFGGDPHVLVATPGQQWTAIQEPPFEPRTLTPASVTCVDAFCIVTGADKNGNVPVNGSAAFLTADFGKTWHLITLPVAMKDLQALSCTPDGDCYLVYDTRTHLFSVMAKSSNRGRTWARIQHARGFTSEGGFSCPTDGSCVYLGDHVLEVSKGPGPEWRDTDSPFTGSGTGSTSAFALSCVRVDQCMIGGGIDNPTPEQVVWIERPPWTATRVTAALRSVDRKDNSALASVFESQAQSYVGGNSQEALNGLLSILQGSVSDVSALALRARRQQQVAIAVIAKRWADLLQTAMELPNDSSSGVPTLSIERTVADEIEAIRAAEREAGDRANNQLAPLFSPIRVA